MTYEPVVNTVRNSAAHINSTVHVAITTLSQRAYEVRSSYLKGPSKKKYLDTTAELDFCSSCIKALTSISNSVEDLLAVVNHSMPHEAENVVSYRGEKLIPTAPQASMSETQRALDVGKYTTTATTTGIPVEKPTPIKLVPAKTNSGRPIVQQIKRPLLKVGNGKQPHEIKWRGLGKLRRKVNVPKEEAMARVEHWARTNFSAKRLLPYTAEEVANELGLSQKAVRVNMRRLIASKILIKDGERSKTRYKLGPKVVRPRATAR